jgi:hypothetical protein
MTSFNVKFIQESQFKRRPFNVSPFFSSTNMGRFFAAVNKYKGNWVSLGPSAGQNYERLTIAAMMN